MVERRLLPGPLMCGVALLVLSLLLGVRAAGDTVPGHDALRETLFEAIAAGDDARLSALVDAHRDAIHAAFGGWMAQHGALNGERRAVFGHALEALAAHFEARGDRTLRGMLSGLAGNQRARGWGRTLREATDRARGGDCTGAVAVLEPLAREIAPWRGDVVAAVATGVDDVLGVCHLEARDYEAALAVTYRAYERAVAREDRVAIAAFGRRMARAHAGAGDLARAREWASATVAILRADGRATEAADLERAFLPDVTHE